MVRLDRPKESAAWGEVKPPPWIGQAGGRRPARCLPRSCREGKPPRLSRLTRASLRSRSYSDFRSPYRSVILTIQVPRLPQHQMTDQQVMILAKRNKILRFKLHVGIDVEGNQVMHLKVFFGPADLANWLMVQMDFDHG